MPTAREKRIQDLEWKVTELLKLLEQHVDITEKLMTRVAVVEQRVIELELAARV